MKRRQLQSDETPDTNLFSLFSLLFPLFCLIAIHAVDFEHTGTSDSSVLYIPICPVTEINGEYVRRMREAWRAGTPGPDFPGGVGESHHLNRPTEAFVQSVTNQMGLASVGLEPLPLPAEGSSAGEIEVIRRVNRSLGF